MQCSFYFTTGLESSSSNRGTDGSNSVRVKKRQYSAISVRGNVKFTKHNIQQCLIDVCIKVKQNQTSARCHRAAAENGSRLKPARKYLWVRTWQQPRSAGSTKIPASDRHLRWCCCLLWKRKITFLLWFLPCSACCRWGLSWAYESSSPGPSSPEGCTPLFCLARCQMRL